MDVETHEYTYLGMKGCSNIDLKIELSVTKARYCLKEPDEFILVFEAIVEVILGNGY